MSESHYSIGIITMHRVQNYGSVLQAYALQRKIRDFGYSSEIIDYNFPNKRRHEFNCKRFIKKILVNGIDTCLGLHPKRKMININDFIDRYLTLTKYHYDLASELMEYPPQNRLYITGSDQVWSPHHVKDDLSFLCPFGKEMIPRIAYAASFGKGSVPEHLRSKYSELLKRYDTISVREESGVEQVKELTNKVAKLVCDPTLLLTEKEWSSIGIPMRKNIKRPYLLAYILSYSFNPYPDVSRIINEIAQRLNLQIVLLNGRRIDIFSCQTQFANEAGPCEFINLFQNADFIVTTSFHGTMFALNFQKPFISIVKNKDTIGLDKNAAYQKDDRINSILHKMNAEERAVILEHELPQTLEMDYTKIIPLIDIFRKDSLLFLKNAIKKSMRCLPLVEQISDNYCSGETSL